MRNATTSFIPQRIISKKQNALYATFKCKIMKLGLLLYRNTELRGTDEWISVSAQYIIDSLVRLRHEVYPIRVSRLDIKRDHAGKIVDILLPESTPLSALNLDGVMSRWSAKRDTVMDVQQYLEENGVISSPHSSEVKRISGKMSGLKTLQAAGVVTPESLLVEDDIPTDDVIYNKLGAPPYVVKADRGTRGMNVFVLYSTRDAIRKVQEIISARGQAGAIIEEFIPPPGMKKSECMPQNGVNVVPRIQPEYFRSLVIGEELHSTIHQIVPQGSAEWIGNRTETVGKLVDLSQEQAAIVLKAAHAFGFRESGIDFMLTHEGKMVVLEVNHSPDLEDHTQLGVPPAESIARGFCTYVQKVKQLQSRGIRYDNKSTEIGENF
jgi:glutathione synthase/RimK-type ligase-like ATP-grasp enzyme